MNDHNSIENINKRSNQEDPIIMYFIVRKSLNMSAGKVAAQCAHAAQMLLLQYFDFLQSIRNDSINESDIIKFAIFKRWLDTSFRKVVLSADDKEFSKIETGFSESIVTVIDNGLTEVEPQTKTVIGVFPLLKSECPKIIKRLQTLK